MTQIESIFKRYQQQETETLETFSVEDEAWYWHTLTFSTLKEAQQAQCYIKMQYDVLCSITSYGVNDHEVCFSTIQEFDGVSRTHLITNIGVSPLTLSFNVSSDEMFGRREPGQVTTWHVLLAILLTILALPFSYALILFYLPKHLAQFLAGDEWKL